ncbi:hypothetical protein DL93DRAFT_2205895 [Clavulina sp. PMI_390]|nr:hypothetical protein DL93DRAFT_2205895 [Clavulina sp. PMI_390]
MALSNPSHILIARSSRLPHATLSTPEAHAGSSNGVPRNSTSPPTMTILASDESEDEDAAQIDYHEPNELTQDEVDPTFCEDYEFPGTVKIKVQETTFWAHKEMLYFASPFFKAALSGGWLETHRPTSVASSIITIHQPPIVLRDGGERQSGSGTTEIHHMATALSELGIGDGQDIEDTDIFTVSEDDEDDSEDYQAKKEQDRHASFEKLEGSKESPSVISPRRTSPHARSTRVSVHRNRKAKARVPEAYIELKEEKAATFHGFLKFVYPHLECVITWNNVEGLTNISHKLVVPDLQEACMKFLFSHAAGRPIKALRIAEIFDEEELYREASRFVLDNPGAPEQEMRTLSQETLLKLEKRRTWFLERVLKLNLIPIAKEYTCCATCPDPSNCARLLEEKWKSGAAALSRFGPIQPSMVFRYLRSLEGGSPPFTLTHHACQQAAKVWVASLFDRMFSLGIRGSPDNVPTDPRVPNAGQGPRRHFLYCQLHEMKTPTSVRKSRVIA